MHKSSIYLPDELKRDLGELATRTGRSEADLIRHAIERLLTASSAAEPGPPPATVNHPRPALVGVGVGPGDPGLVTERARATLLAADRVIVISTDVRSVGRAEMVARSAAPTARLQRVAFTISGDADSRHASLLALADEVLAATDGDPSQWTLFPELAEAVATARPALHITAEPGITSYQAAAAAAGAALGVAGAAMVVLDGVRELPRHLDGGGDSVVLYKASTDAQTVKAAAADTGRRDAIVAELSGLPGQRLVSLDATPDGPMSYLATVVFPARRPVPAAAPA